MADPVIAAGGPGSDGTAAPEGTTPAAVPAATSRITIGGVQYDVPAALADGLARDRDRIAGEYGSRAQAYERRLAELESAVASTQDDQTPQGPKPPDPRDLQYDTDKYHRDNLAYTNALVASAAQSVEERRMAERRTEAEEAQRNRVWAGQVEKFYSDHPELKGSEDIVDTVWQRNFGSLGRLQWSEGSVELAKLATARIVALSEKGRALAASATPTLETSRSSRRRAPEPTADEPSPNIRGISDAIKAKQARFRMPYKKAAA